MCRAAEAAYKAAYRRLKQIKGATWGTRIAAKDTRDKIRRLVIDGFTKADIARHLGYAGAKLQIGERITLQKAAKVRRFWSAFMAEGHDMPWRKEEAE